MKRIRCCKKHDDEKSMRGYITLPCFKISLCDHCGEANLICNDFLALVFKIFFLPFWKGHIKLIAKPDRKEEVTDET